jgi:hypothetical protein
MYLTSLDFSPRRFPRIEKLRTCETLARLSVLCNNLLRRQFYGHTGALRIGTAAGTAALPSHHYTSRHFRMHTAIVGILSGFGEAEFKLLGC